MVNLIIEVTDKCNLECSYCYNPVRNKNMRDLSQIKNVLETVSSALDIESIRFIGGEPLIVELDFYKKVIEFEKELGIKTKHSLQTNGTLITEDYISFFKDENFGVGISLDGNSEVNNTCRKGKNDIDTYSVISQNIKKIDESGIKWGIISVLSKASLGNEKEIMETFKKLNARSVKFLECVSPHTDYLMLSNEELFDTWKNLFEIWMNGDGKPIIEPFHKVTKSVLGGTNNICSYTGCCKTNYLTFGLDNKFYGCERLVNQDKFQVSPELFVQNDIIPNILSKDCQNCDYLALCNGGCMYDRLAMNLEKTYYCDARKKFFEYVKTRLEDML